MCEIRLQRLTNMVIEKETDTGVVLICQTSTLHLQPSPGPASTKGFLAALTHSSKTGNTRRGSHGADPTEPGIPLGSQAQPAALLSSLCTLQTAFPNQRCSGWGRRGAQGLQDELLCLVSLLWGGCQGRAARGAWPATGCLWQGAGSRDQNPTVLARILQ